MTPRREREGGTYAVPEEVHVLHLDLQDVLGDWKREEV